MKAEQTVIFGTNAILEKLKASPEEIVEILLAGEAGGAVETAAERLGVRVVRGSRDLLDRIAVGARHQGAVARVAAYWVRGPSTNCSTTPLQCRSRGASSS